MTKSLKDLFEVYRPKAKDEADFVDKHVTIKHKDRNGNGDDVFKGNTKYIKRKEERHGYDVDEDEKVYEETEIPLSHRNKREVSHYRVLNNGRDVTRHDSYEEANEYAKKHRAKLKKDGRRSDQVTVHAYVKEEVEELDELSRKTLASYVKKAGGNSLNSVGYHGMVRATSISHGGIPDEEEYQKSKRIMNKRAQGITRAADRLAKEEVEPLEEGTMKLSKVHIVHHHDHPAAKEFAKNYTEGMKRDHREGGPTAADEKASEKFHERYHGVRTREGFAGGGTYVYHDRKTGGKWKVDRVPNGKTFYGTDHIISHHTGGLHEDVDQDIYFTEEEEMVIRSLAGAAEELGEELDLETLAGLAEEVLSELSTDTLRKYRSKAKDDAYDAYDVDDDRRLRKRSAGSYTAGKKILKRGDTLRSEEVENLDEISKATMGSYLNKANKDLKAAKGKQIYFSTRGYTTPEEDKKISKRSKGLGLVNKKMTKEEVEQIDEIGNTSKGKKVLGNYIKKAGGTSLDSVAALAYEGGRGSKPAFAKSVRRAKGIMRAADRLTKEDIISKAIETYIPEDVELPSLQERLVDKLDQHNISEAHIHILLSMFDSLNEQNQNRMLESVQTVDGINSLLDFAISNRGE